MTVQMFNTAMMFFAITHGLMLGLLGALVFLKAFERRQ